MNKAKARPAPPAQPPVFAKSKRQLAKACGVTAAAVQAWDIRPGFPGKTENGFDVQAIETWRSSNLQPDRSAKSNEASGDQARLLKAQADEREAKARKAEHDLAVQLGEYVPKAEIKSRDEARIHVVKRGLFSGAKRLAQELAALDLKHPKEFEAKLTKEFRAICDRFAAM